MLGTKENLLSRLEASCRRHGAISSKLIESSGGVELIILSVQPIALKPLGRRFGLSTGAKTALESVQYHDANS